MNSFCKQVTFAIIFLFAGSNLFASHGTGGELTWRCLGTGQYVFQVKFYRDCNGIPGPNSITISTTVPGVPSIPATLFSQTDISPDGLASDGTTSCPNCPQGNGGSPIFGLIEEFVYESAPVTLTGIPPAGGWTFSWGECCRSGSLININNAGSVGFLLQAKMFSFNGQNANPCFDSSPYFAERPNAILCTGLPIVYHHLTADPEFDSLSYDFTNPLNDAGGIIPFAAGYSAQNPLADSVTLNTSTGEYSFNSTTAGNFVMVIKVSAFKCGILVSEIRREINVLIENNCPPVFGGINIAPVTNAPFVDSTGMNFSYADTVIAGDTVNFQIFMTDFNLFTNGSAQIITNNAFGQQYGTNFTDPNSGCAIPPCAVLTFPTPISAPVGLQQGFNWTTTPAHLGYSLSCVQFSNTYYFLNKVQDNYCPANASSTRVISITVLPGIPVPPVVNNGGNLECNLGSSYMYQWFFNRFAIPGATASSYMPTQTGTYQVLAIAPDGQGNYSDGIFMVVLGLNEHDALDAITVKPNPSADGIFNFDLQELKSFNLSMLVTDVVGKEIFFEDDIVAENNVYSLNLVNTVPGIYTVRLQGIGALKTFKVIRY